MGELNGLSFIVPDLESNIGENETAMLSQLATILDDVVQREIVVDWQNKPDAQNAIKNALEDEIIEAFAAQDKEIEIETLDFILDNVLQAARRHYPR